MTTSTMGSLRELQSLDRRIRDLNAEIAEFDPQLAEVEDPALRLEGELEQLHRRLEQMREDEQQHSTAAIEAGGLRFPAPVKFGMSLVSKVMTKATYRI